MKIKKIICCMLAAISTISLLGCAGLAQLISPTPTPTATPTATPSPTPKPTPTPTPTPEPSPTPEAIPEAKLSAFVNGENNSHGYRSSFFRIGFYVPADWSVYSRKVINKLNHIDESMTDLEEIRQETIEKLSKTNTIADFISFNIETTGHVFVFVVDVGDFVEPIESEREALEYFEGTLLDPDSASSKSNLNMTTKNLGGVDHPVCLYDVTVRGEKHFGATVMILRGTTIAAVQIEAPVESDLTHIFRSFYSLDG